MKIGAARRRLAERAADDGASFEQFRGDACTPDDVASALMMPSLLGGSRIVLADGVDKWKAADVEPVAQAIASLGSEAAASAGAQATTVVLIGAKKPLAAIDKAVAGVGGEVKEFKAPGVKALPGWLQAQAGALDVTLNEDAARMMIDLVGAERPRYLLSELEKLATHAGAGGTITSADVDVLGTGEAVPKVFALTDAVLSEDAPRAIELARELIDAGERPQGILFALVRSVGQAQQAAAVLGGGGDVAGELGISPWLASKVTDVARVRGEDSLKSALERLAELDFNTKGGNQLDDETNLFVTLEAIA